MAEVGAEEEAASEDLAEVAAAAAEQAEVGSRDLLSAGDNDGKQAD